MQPLLALDFDRTLFNTNKFSDAIWRVIEGEFSISADEAKKLSEDFYTHVGKMYNYDFYSHLASLGIHQEVVNIVLHNRLDGEPFLYDDAAVVIDLGSAIQTEILTFGGIDYQQLKLSFCPELKGIPVTIVQEMKADYLSRHYIDRRVVLVDDKLLIPPDFPKLSTNVEFVYLNRDATKTIVRHPEYIEINSLRAMSRVL